MTYSIKLVVNDAIERKKIVTWLTHTCFENISIQPSQAFYEHDIVIFEINTPFDWIKVKRLIKKYNNITIFPLISPSMVETASIAIELNLPSIFMKPMKKHLFYRNVKKVLDNMSAINLLKEKDYALYELGLQRLLKGEAVMDQLTSFLEKGVIPNVVYFIQGFVHTDFISTVGNQASPLIQKELLKRFKEIGHDVYFLPFRKHLVLLARIPSEVSVPSLWKEGEAVILATIADLLKKYGIQLYMGVGTIYRELSELRQSYEEAKKARSLPPINRLCLRFYDEIPNHSSIQTGIDYIDINSSENISVQDVAKEVCFSANHFSRVFKKETGYSFVAYLTFIRVQKSVWLLRNTDQSIEQIAFEQGFNTPSYFSRIFKKLVGISPSEYRATKEIIFT